MSYLLAYDVGTSGCKAVLVTPGGEVAAKNFEPYPTYYPKPLYAEQDVNDWWRAVAAVTRRLLAVSGAAPGDILSLSFSSQMLNTVLLDAQGDLLRPCISWLDGRAWQEAHRAMAKLGGERVFTLLAGGGITGKDMIPKYIWLKKNEPEIYARTAAILDCGNYILYRATGKIVCEWSVARVTGMFNLKTKQWDRTMMRLFGLAPEKFPPLVRSIDPVGGLSSQAAADLGLISGIPVFGGAGDAMCTAIGAGAVAEGDTQLCLGTSGYVTVATARQFNGVHGVYSLQSADPEKLLLIAESETVGECLRWGVRALYCAEPDAAALAAMDGEVADTAPGSGNLLFTPWLYGERCPVPDESVRGGYLNLSANHTRGQMARAIYEGTAYNFRWILDLIQKKYGFECNPLRTIGGGALGLPWLEIIADVTGRTLVCAANPREASAYGAALIAAVGLGIAPSIEATKAMVPVTKTVEPDSAHREVYERLYSTFRQIYPAVKGLYHELNRSS
jgi:xylulokinase